MKNVGIIVVAAVLLTGMSGSAAERLKTPMATGPEALRGTYTLILYGGTYFNDPEAVAILDVEGDGYTIEPRAPVFKYTTMKGMSPDAALKEARIHIGSHRSAMDSTIRSITGGDGTVIGYEILPRYLPFVFGRTDVIESSYYLTGSGAVNAYIRLDPSVEHHLLFSGGGGGYH